MGPKRDLSQSHSFVSFSARLSSLDSLLSTFSGLSSLYLLSTFCSFTLSTHSSPPSLLFSYISFYSPTQVASFTSSTTSESRALRQPTSTSYAVTKHLCFESDPPSFHPICFRYPRGSISFSTPRTICL